jgi:hypothetical protein
MTPEKATALRRPFPPETVGKLPKPYSRDSQKGNCNECGGYHGLPAVHLDYVGHAAVTERLLTVDPEWSWEPFATDEQGLPTLDRAGNLWIRLTIGGVTRIGVGDGKSAKECIGDAIRNAAMRFGVALDLWAKEDLVEFAQYASRPTEPAEQPADPWADKPTAESPLLNTSSKLAKALYANLRDHGIDKEGANLLYREVAGREVTSSKELTEDEARAVLKELDTSKAGDQ